MLVAHSNNRKREYLKLRGKTSLRGQATVEFALVLTILVLMIYGILEVSRLVFINTEVSNAAREAARYAAVTPGATHTDLVAVVDSKMALADPSSIQVCDSACLGNSNTLHTFNPVQVKVTYEWTTLVPFLQLGQLTLSSTATELIEYDPPAGGN
jgi:Flp pilus assembly protein TadG